MNTLEWNKIKSVVTLSGDTQDAIDVTKILTKEVLDLGKNILVGGVQCRVTALFYIYLATVLYHISPEEALNDTVITGVGFFLAFFSFASTGGGIPTAQSYYRTKKHIAKMGTLGEKYFKKMMGADAEYPRQGYCQLQGMYLACRAMEKKYPGLKKKCLEYRAKHTQNIMPLG